MRPLALAVWSGYEACSPSPSGIFGRPALHPRDRIGIKPLYYTQYDGNSCSPQKSKALLQWPGVPREIDPLALRQYLQLRYVPGPRRCSATSSNFSQAQAHRFPGQDRLHEYWDLPLDKAEASAGNDVVEHFRIC